MPEMRITRQTKGHRRADRPLEVTSRGERPVVTLAIPLAVAALLMMVAVPPVAIGLVRSAVAIDGPSSDIISLGGVAIAPDGTGGLVYVKRDQGEAHVFVSRFVYGSWQPPRRV